jgi:hypothetical protein
VRQQAARGNLQWSPEGVTYTFQLDPCEILGISASASLQEIREAYRARTKKYHPDLGGDEWAFRVLTRSYEIVSTARVAGRASEEQFRAAAGPQRAPQSPPRASHFDAAQSSASGSDTSRARRGVRDQVDDPAKLVEIEMLLIRFEVENPLTLLAGSAEDRSLSCTLNVAWPVPELAPRADRIPHAEQTLASVSGAFESVANSARVVSTQSDIEDGRFTGWLSFSTVARAEEGFRALRAALADRGFGVEQWVREMAIPRTWRE